MGKHQDLIERLNEREARKRHRALRDMRRMARDRERRPIGNDGAHEMRVHAKSFHYWGGRLGYDCWNDDGFKREYRRDVPESRVKVRTVRASSTLALAPEENVRALFGPDGRMRRRTS